MPTGTEAQQLARLTHATEVHGLELVALCEGCQDNENAEGCKVCRGEGHLFRFDRPEPCGPDCPLLDARPI